MKRTKFLFNKIVSFDNLRIAYLNARKGKTSKPAIKKFSKNVNQNLQKLHERMVKTPPELSSYHQFKIFDPKERVISVVPFSDRVIHHAIINVLEPIFEKQFIFHSYACRKNKGTHKAALYAHKKAKSCKWFLKLDVRKFFDSINHDVLKLQILKIVKDKKVIQLLFGIIDSYQTSQFVQPAELKQSFVTSELSKGLPIGNLTSQFFANLYLSCLDHFIIEKLHPLGYVRYMDDMIIFSNSKDELISLHSIIEEYSLCNLFLSLKPAIFKRTREGIPFLGWVIFKDHIKLSAKVKKRMKRKIAFIISQYEETKAFQRIDCILNTRKIVW